MTYYLYKINFKNGKKYQIYLKDVTKADVLGYINTGQVESYNQIIINWGEVQTVKCHELKDEVLTKIVDGQEKTMLASNETAN
jgi:hypothetical protein